MYLALPFVLSVERSQKDQTLKKNNNNKQNKLDINFNDIKDQNRAKNNVRMKSY